ncbi:Ger(x)C family spore germination C-terminal domain-containing protein [Paenibacillus sacheonensis]|uniref:Ger(X)C family spore germination protein n=1 Tax=Paenibacillus sacheonensis TaxID=742054 RepID=A0A7X5C2M8_9BACL|nr:Ger(x)C family spore germination C-terminal domain-containing protein [Paenibacillus sacheonensis]MBM7566346.1 Ger(x)C family germination protein [Paenibacillus sacheonensis]NBC70549.1 hypothetical protein [Paenibacillus sacheonensis]
MKDINELAMVDMASVDIVPGTNRLVAYYQVINPTGSASRQTGPAKASVYTYYVSEESPGRFNEETRKIMSRMLFTQHIQCYVFTERFARTGMVDLFNYLELNPDRRTNVYVVVTDAPIRNIMESFTPLDRVPGRNLRMLMDLQAKSAGFTRKLTQVKDIVAGIPLSRPTVIPMLHYHGKRPASLSDRVEYIQASDPGFEISDGAVFVHAKMVGKIDQSMKKLYFVLNGDARKGVESIVVNGSIVDLELRDIKVKRKWGPSRLRITVHVKLRGLFNEQKKHLSGRNLNEIERSFNEAYKKKAEEFIRFGREKDWDLLGIGDVKQGRGRWRDFDVSIEVKSMAVLIGNTRTPYQ